MAYTDGDRTKSGCALGHARVKRRGLQVWTYLG